MVRWRTRTPRRDRAEEEFVVLGRPLVKRAFTQRDTRQ
ncbi:hypothetical protein GFS60_04501 [Rhodococcus sp. WAY2]|nr:hypothetical protein GFS60_04501 [Rhodococcus sp. WAY2]